MTNVEALERRKRGLSLLLAAVAATAGHGEAIALSPPPPPGYQLEADAGSPRLVLDGARTSALLRLHLVLNAAANVGRSNPVFVALTLRASGAVASEGEPAALLVEGAGEASDLCVGGGFVFRQAGEQLDRFASATLPALTCPLGNECTKDVDLLVTRVAGELAFEASAQVMVRFENGTGVKPEGAAISVTWEEVSP